MEMKASFKTIINRDAKTSDKQMMELMAKGYIIVASCITPLQGIIDSEPSFIYVFSLQRVFHVDNDKGADEEEEGGDNLALTSADDKKKD